MAQQSKITSRPLTKALGTASILSVAIAGANIANAIQTDFGVDYRADAFYIDGDAYGTDRSANGIANLLRLKADFKDENTGVSLHTSVQLAGDYWSGDSRDDTGNGYSDDANESVTLDTGYVQIPMGGNLLRVGRQASNWNNCFLSCDDRRDRFSALFPTSVGTFVFNYDRRSDSDGTAFGASQKGDSPMLAYVTRFGEMNFGILYVHYLKNSGSDPDAYALQGAHILSPYISGSLTEGVNLTAGVNWVGGNEKNDENAFWGDGEQYQTASGIPVTYDGRAPQNYEYTDGWSGYLRLDGDIGALNWGVQYVGAIDGGLIDRGFDTYFSTMNNNPAATGSPTSLISMGRGYGMKDYDQHLLAAKLGFDITPRFNLTGAVGYLKVDNGQYDVDDNSMLYDISASYKVNDAVTTVASIGVAGNNEAFAFGTLNSLIDVPSADISAGDELGNVHSGAGGNQFGAGAPSDFDNEDLVAANVGIRVKF